MSHKEILEQAITKAIAAGWRPFKVHGNTKDYSATVLKDYEVTESYFAKGQYCCDFEGIYTNDYIFDHDFAKALWGELEERQEVSRLKDFTIKTAGYGDSIPYRVINKGWKYHLQAMVISDDPIQYLGDNL